MAAGASASRWSKAALLLEARHTLAKLLDAMHGQSLRFATRAAKA